MSDAPKGLEFPAEIDFKALADDVPELVAELTARVAAHAALTEAGVRTRPSSAGRYLAVTIHAEVQSREQMLAVYQALRAHPAVKWTL